MLRARARARAAHSAAADRALVHAARLARARARCRPTRCAQVVPISKAAARQRAGRAGRERAGKCFRLYTEHTFFNELEASAPAEIARANLAAVVLSLKALGVTDVTAFEFVQSPPRAALLAALEHLLVRAPARRLARPRPARRATRASAASNRFPQTTQPAPPRARPAAARRVRWLLALRAASSCAPCRARARPVRHATAGAYAAGARRA